MNDITIVYSPTIDFRFLHQRPQQMMKAFAQLSNDECNVTTIYMNPANYRKQVDEIETPYANLPNFKVIRMDYANPQNTYTFIKRMSKGKVVHWISWGANLGMTKNIGADILAYDSIDSAEDEFAAWKPYIKPLELSANIIFTSADVMLQDHSKRHSNVHSLPNGADFEHFNIATRKARKRPFDIPDRKPIIGYYGALASWVDFEIVKSIAKDFTVVMVGSTVHYNEQINHPNVYILPAKDYSILPDYLSYFDACVIPFKLTKMIEGCDPIKFYEYISAGKPVIASEMAELKKYSDIMYFANKDNASQIVKQALEENSFAKQQSRIEVAKQNSWLHRAEYALEQIKRLDV